MKVIIHKISTLLKTSNLYVYIILNKKVLVCHLLMFLLFLVFKYMQIFDWATFLSAFIPAVVSLCAMLMDSSEYSSNIKIMSLCYDYMHKKEGISIDDILGILISNKYRSKVKKPTDSFFDILEEKCINGEVEEKRRIAEAIPMLYKINRRETKNIIVRLRKDYDNVYHDDNRRRVIESFRYYNKYHVFDHFFVRKMLKMIEGDSMYTIIAIIEIIIFTDIINDKMKESELIVLKEDLKEKNNFTDRQIEFINEAIQFLKEVNEIKKHEKLDLIFQKYMNQFKQSKFYMKILISKNIINICPYHIQCKRKNKCLNDNNKRSILDFFDLCLSDERNVRRPMAKEDVCYCLLRMMTFPEVADEAEERIMRLIKDKDEIISITAFDYIYDIYDKDTKLFDKILKYCISLPENNILYVRAKHITNMVE